MVMAQSKRNLIFSLENIQVHSIHLFRRFYDKIFSAVLNAEKHRIGCAGNQFRVCKAVYQSKFRCHGAKCLAAIIHIFLFFQN